MADIKTHLRELSVAITVGLLNERVEFTPSDLLTGSRFIAYAKKIINNDISGAENLTDYNVFTGELKIIVENGYKLGKSIYENSYFKIPPDATITWIGNDTQKGDPIDITIGNYGFSLKEESFILKNMGLYQLLNDLTGSNYVRGFHVFNVFAQKEYDEWFAYTWKSFYEYLITNTTWELHKNKDVSKAFISGSNIILKFNGKSSYVPINTKTNAQFMVHTTSKTREKVFSKWIKNEFANESKYISLKKLCSETAGKKVSEKINTEFKPDNVYDFFQIHDKEYYYAKTTLQETTVLKVPSKADFKEVIKFIGCRYEVPESQLNIISAFENQETGTSLEFRNECRFSHGQFNGTPEAKMYISHNTSLTDLYTPI